MMATTLAAPAATNRVGPLLWGALAVGLALRVWEAAGSSLWLDELHTLSHAAQPDLASVAASVSREVHTPLFFLCVHLFGAFEQGAWLRAIPVLSSLVVLWPLVDMARRTSAGPRAALLTAWLYACLPYQVHWATELRPYAWVGLFSACAAWIAFAERGSRVLRFALFFLCVLLGLYTHRIMAVTVFSIGVARLFVRTPGMLRLGWLILAGVLAVGPFLPWLASFAGSATEARLEYQESVGGYQLRPALVKEVLALPARLFVPFMGALGGAWARLAFGAGVLFFVALGVGIARRVRERAHIPPAPALLRGLALFAAVDFVLVTALAIWTWDRVPLQYYAPLAWLLPLFAAEVLAPLTSPAGRAAAGAACVAALLLGVAQAGGHSTEDIRGAVARARELGAELAAAGPAPIYTALLSQPASFEHRLPYLAYAPDLDAREPDRVPRPGDADFDRPLVVLRRGTIPYENELWAPLREGRRVAREERIDFYLTVMTLLPEGGGGGG